MRPERHYYQPLRPYEVFGLNNAEVAQMRITAEKFKQILADKNTVIQAIEIKSNQFGEFLYLTAHRRHGRQQVTMTFYGLGYHRHRERWITREWFWYQTNLDMIDTNHKMTLEEAEKQLIQRQAEIMQSPDQTPQSKRGHQFELMANEYGDNEALDKFSG